MQADPVVVTTAHQITVVRDGNILKTYNVPPDTYVQIIEIDRCSELAVAMTPDLIAEIVSMTGIEPDFGHVVDWLRVHSEDYEEVDDFAAAYLNSLEVTPICRI